MQLWYTKTLMSQGTLLCPGEDELSSVVLLGGSLHYLGGELFCMAPSSSGLPCYWGPLPMEGSASLLFPLMVNTHLCQMAEGRLPLLSACHPSNFYLLLLKWRDSFRKVSIETAARSGERAEKNKEENYPIVTTKKWEQLQSPTS